MRAHFDAWMNRVWEKHQGNTGIGESKDDRERNICSASDERRKAFSKKDKVEDLTANLRDKKVKDNIAPLFEQALRLKQEP